MYGLFVAVADQLPPDRELKEELVSLPARV